VHRDSSVSQSGVSRTSSSVFLYIVRCPECTRTAGSVSLVFLEHRHQFSVYSPVSKVHSDSSVSQSGDSRTLSAFFSSQGTAVSVTLVFQQHRHHFSVHSPLSSTQGQQCPTVWCFKNIVSSSVYNLVSRVHRDSSVSQSGDSITSLAVVYRVRCPAHRDSNVRQSGASRTSSALLYVYRCLECTATAVSVSLVFQEHRHQFSVYIPVSRVHRVSSVSQSGVSSTSSSVFCI